jgi:hypothetical protein
MRILFVGAEAPTYCWHFILGGWGMARDTLFQIFMQLKTIFVDEFIKFILKGFFSMMSFLIVDVVGHSVEFIFGDCNGIIFILPFKFGFGESLFIDPKRGFSFDQLHYFLNGLIYT